ncbi:MAG: hypothetical protein WA878_06685, partial [Pseudomonas sp.]
MKPRLLLIVLLGLLISACAPYEGPAYYRTDVYAGGAYPYGYYPYGPAYYNSGYYIRSPRYYAPPPHYYR